MVDLWGLDIYFNIIIIRSLFIFWWDFDLYFRSVDYYLEKTRKTSMEKKTLKNCASSEKKARKKGAKKRREKKARKKGVKARKKGARRDKKTRRREE
jgi:hypothetical protein